MKTMHMFLTAGLAAAVSTGALGATISGRVLNERGQAIAGADLDFFVVATGQERSANNDATDANGNYATTVDNQIYDVYYTAPAGTRYAGYVQRNVNLNSNQTVNVVLKDAWFLAGEVRRADTGGPARDVDLDFKDLSTGQKIFTPRDNSGLDGRYSVAVPKGIYEITLDGPEPAVPSDPPQLAPARIQEVSVTGDADLVLPNLTMVLGHAVDGELLDALGDGIINVDLDFLVAGTEDKIFTQHDNTDNRGLYHTIVPPGVYDLEYLPPVGAVQPAAIRRNTVILAPANLGTQTINDGWLVQGNVRDPDGNPLRAVDLDVFPAAGGPRTPTSSDETDAAGHYAIRLFSGTYTIVFRSQVNSLVDLATRSSISVTSNRVLTDTILPYHDSDGDGWADARDDCPFVANVSQLDADADGAGDQCDNCPSTANARQTDNDRDRLGDSCDPDDDGDGLGDTIDSDDDGDGRTDGADNCPSERNATQLDRDSDGSGDACDPDDREVEGLVAASREAFTWRPETGATTYHVYRQRLSWLSSINYGACFRDDLGARVFRDTDLPQGPGAGFGYLVTARTAAGEGSLGRRGDGAERPNLRPCP